MRPGSGPCAWSTPSHPSCRDRVGAGSRSSSQESAGRTLRLSTAGAPGTSRISSASLSFRATRSWGSPPATMTSLTVGSSWSPPSAVWRGRSLRHVRRAPKAGHGGCERVAFGKISAGLQIGYCADTGGGWSAAGLVAHESQIHAVPDDVTDEEAVMVEPTACAVHAALAAEVGPGLGGRSARCRHARAGHGCGASTRSAPRRPLSPGRVTRTRGSWRQQLGADIAVTSDEVPRAVRRRTRSLETRVEPHRGRRCRRGLRRLCRLGCPSSR